MIKLIREHLSTKIFIITVCLLITVGSAIYGMVALGMSRSYFLELDRSLSNQTEKMVLQLSNTSVQKIDGILKMFALEHGISIVLKDSDEKVLGIYGDMEYSLAPGTDVEDILLGSGITESYQYAIFKVQNAGKYDQVKKSVQKANIDWSRYDLIDNNGNIKNMTENFGQMDQMSMGLLLIVSVSGLVILVLVFLFWIKNRTQEIGIMMSLGKCKFEIWVQFLWEAVMISIIGMLLSFAISPIIAETSASYLAKETQTLRLEQQEQENTGTYIDGYIAPDLKIQDVEVHITKEMVLMDIGMISGILIIAVLVAGITIMKKRPKQILSEMS